MTPETETKTRSIVINLVGTEGQLDIAESDYAVVNVEDAAERAKSIILELGKKYRNYGWSIISGEKEDCPSCTGELIELKYETIKVQERVACPFWDVVEPEGEICRINAILCPEEGSIWPDCCPLLNNDGVLVEVEPPTEQETE